ncbi:Arf GTPase activating protein [Paraphysoderma sedebokerense]|nr:Arf GTPase activating protein [Paraphysoderma sedebokerense]
MSTRTERMNDKSLNEKHAKILKELMAKPENKICVDCKKKDPRWASWNLGVFFCIRCSGIHRAMGTHISRVKSADLDTWTPEQIQSMLKWGNTKANWYWEHNVTYEPTDS